MLNEIRVSNFAIIQELQIPFYQGLNMISGETGAGKSILIKSLGLLMGGKAHQKDIRQGEKQAIIEGSFDLSHRDDIMERLTEKGIQCEEDQLVVRRILQKSGKSRVYLNGNLSTIQDLRHLVYPLVTLSNPVEAPLIEITGQHENRNLTSPEYQLELLDQYAQTQTLKDNCKTLFSKWSAAKQELTDMEAQVMEREQRMDFLKFQIDEIQGLELSEGDDDRVREKIQFLRQQERWQEWFQFADTGLSEDIIQTLHRIRSQAPDPTNGDLQGFFDQLQQATVLLEDCSFTLNQSQESLAADEGETLDDLESQLNRIRKLQKKFGDDIQAILEQFTEMKSELSELENSDHRKQDLEKEIRQMHLELKSLCLELSQKRAKAAKTFSTKVNKELKDLNMKGLQFLIQSEATATITSTGQDNVTFLIQNSKSDEPRPMGQTASGGELSRILLSVKQVLGHSKHPRTFLFDEVDTGVSGQTAERVGAKLKNLAKGQQVLCVTHLPQVACYGDVHFYIEKTPHKSSVQMAVRELRAKDRVQEIARLISGEKITKTSLAHAKQLLGEVH